MVSFFIFVLGLIWNSIFFMSNPFMLIWGLFLLSFFSFFFVSWYFSFLLGFCFFMCLISGVLVLISYCTALIPFSVEEVYWSVSGGWLYRFLLKIVLLSIIVFSLLEPVEGSSEFLFYRGVESLVVSDWWLKLIILVSLYLFFAIVVCLTVSSKFSGALVSELS
nr:NADH dehydrogenase subunit 6 [Xylophagaidae sp. E23]UPX88975.1 NADH dehydrogenase subunit 6 [Xylophagaidae sp. E81]